MFRRKKTPENSDGAPSAASIDRATRPAWPETRPFTFTRPDAEGSGERAEARAGLHYADAGPDGQPREVREIVTSFTQAGKDGKCNLLDISDHLRRDVAPSVAAQLPEDAELTGLYMVEFPPESEHEGTTLHQGFALEATGIAKKRFYSFVEERSCDGAVRMRVIKEADIPETAPFWAANQLVPRGARVTTSVRGEVPLTETSVLPEVEEPSYERYLTATMRDAIDAHNPGRGRPGMHVKEKDILHAIPLRIPADQGRPFSIRPEHQNMPERPSRVEFGEPVKLLSGASYNAYTTIASHTVPHDGRAAYAGIDETFAKMASELTREKPRLADIKAQCLIEYPRDNPNAPMDAVVVTQSRDKMIGYVIQETKQGITVSERVTIYDAGARGKKKRQQEEQSSQGRNVPSGSRITYEVRGREPANDNLLAETQPPFEAGLMTRARYAIEDFNDAHPGGGDIRLE